MDVIITDPIFHGARDELDDDHPLAWEGAYCATCSAMVHAGSNECMQEWFETFLGPMCFDCFATHPKRGDLPGPGSVISDDSPIRHWLDPEQMMADHAAMWEMIRAYRSKWGPSELDQAVVDEQLLDYRLQLPAWQSRVPRVPRP
jgi:hypothetical protein